MVVLDECGGGGEKGIEGGGVIDRRVMLLDYIYWYNMGNKNRDERFNIYIFFVTGPIRSFPQHRNTRIMIIRTHHLRHEIPL